MNKNKKTVVVSNVSKTYKTLEVFKNLNFSCEQGKIIGITGPNGSGKSIFFKLLSGLISPTQGDITIFNENITKSKKIAPQLGALIEEPGFIESYSGFENLKFLGDIKNIISKADIYKVLEEVGLESVQNKKVKTYSLGMKKKLGIAQAIMEHPKLLLLDEPMNALDQESVVQIRKILKDLASIGTTILIVSHNPEDINLLCDKVYLISDKSLISVD